MTAAVTRAAALTRTAMLAFAAALAVACVFAFVGLSIEGYWVDELFSVFVINHHGGVAEVWRRALTDIHPPFYYLALFEWSQLFGRSEIALRGLSAALCVGAVGVFLLGARGVFSLGARLFAAAVGAASPFWFFQSQNARSYALCLLAASVLTVLALRARVAVSAQGRAPAWVIAGLALAGAVASFSHFYAFLATGVLFGLLILTLPDRRLRLWLVLTGALIFVAQLAYLRALLHATQQDPHGTWFRADAAFFAGQTYEALRGFLAPGALIGVIALAATAFWPRPGRTLPPPAPEALWSVRIGLAVVAGVIATGIGVSVAFAPSYSNMNLSIAGPFLWPALAALADLGVAPTAGVAGSSDGGRTADGARAAALAVAAVALLGQLATQAERFLPRGEAWRETAALVLSQPGCAGQPIPVLTPARFGPPTPFFRALAQRDFYGFYVPGPSSRLIPYRADELANPAVNPTLRPRLSPADACPVVAWAVHDINQPQADALADRLAIAGGAAPGAVRAVAFDTYWQVWTLPRRARVSFVFLRHPAG